MKIKRLDLGIARVGDEIAWKDPYFNAGKLLCGCYSLDVWIFYATWLGDECYYPCSDPECDCKK